MNKGFIKLSVLFAGLLALVGVVGYLVSANKVEANNENSQGVPCKTILIEKDGEWNEVEGEGKGQLHYGINRIEFQARRLSANTNYTLIEYPEPQTTWPWPIVRIASGTSTNGGTLELSADYQLKVGYKYWLVLTSDLVDDTISGWHPDTILFERELIPENECTVQPTPTEEPKDYCDTLEGTQAEDEDCPREEEPTPTPEPTPTEQPRTTEALAPACPNSVPVLDLKNPHVIRNGSDATVNAFVPEGDRVNVYFRTSGQPVWQHALRDVPVTNGYMSVTVHDLNPTGDYDFGIQASNGCAGGEIVAVIVDSFLPQTFMFTRWERL